MISFSYYMVTRSLISNDTKVLFTSSPSVHALAQIPWSNTPVLRIVCIQCNGLFTFEEKIPCAVDHCRIPSRFSYFLNTISLIGKSKTQLSCAILQTVFLCKYYVFIFCNYCSLMSMGNFSQDTVAVISPWFMVALSEVGTERVMATRNLHELMYGCWC
jgi:hypothetical protein